MLSSVLKSERAIAMNILIMRSFVQLRRTLSETARLGSRVDEIEKRVDEHGAVIDEIVGALQALEGPPAGKPREIGFRSKT